MGWSNQNNTHRIDQLVDAFLKKNGLYRRFKEAEIPDIWRAVVGNMIASRTSNIHLYQNVLYVSASSAVVRQELSMVKEGIKSALNERIGEPLIKEIVIK